MNRRNLLGPVLQNNFTLRRIIALIVGLAGLGICAAALFGSLPLNLWQTAVVLVISLLILEWAG